jgi:hypothetical protein
MAAGRLESRTALFVRNGCNTFDTGQSKKRMAGDRSRADPPHASLNLPAVDPDRPVALLHCEHCCGRPQRPAQQRATIGTGSRPPNHHRRSNSISAWPGDYRLRHAAVRVLGAAPSKAGYGRPGRRPRAGFSGVQSCRRAVDTGAAPADSSRSVLEIDMLTNSCHCAQGSGALQALSGIRS